MLYTVSRTPWTRDQLIARLYLHTQHKQNKRKQASRPEVGFEPMIPAFEWEKMFHAVIGLSLD
jgi:uncharacterized protein (DUF2132 family)